MKENDEIFLFFHAKSSLLVGPGENKEIFLKRKQLLVHSVAVVEYTVCILAEG